MERGWYVRLIWRSFLEIRPPSFKTVFLIDRSLCFAVDYSQIITVQSCLSTICKYLCYGVIFGCHITNGAIDPSIFNRIDQIAAR
jgi:hypothetical protein